MKCLKLWIKTNLKRQFFFLNVRLKKWVFLYKDIPILKFIIQIPAYPVAVFAPFKTFTIFLF